MKGVYMNAKTMFNGIIGGVLVLVGMLVQMAPTMVRCSD